MNNCLFCKIANGEINSNVIFEDDIIVAFLDIHPDSPGHTLIVPKVHFSDLDDISVVVLSHVMEVAKQLKILIDERLNPDGMVLTQNNGFVQEIKHYHLHLIPKYKGNSKKLSVSEVYEILRSEK
ncbi:MAG: HIT domain-containing protein [Bacilli bacterium]|nr:HIT domain-containing protein [Bacilli bacterium]